MLRDTGTSSAQTAGCGHRNPARATGYTGLLVTEHCRFQNRSAAGSGTGVLLVTEKSAVPIITGKEPASNPVLTTGSPVTEVSSRATGYRELPVPGPKCCWLQRNLMFPSLLARN